MKMSETAVRETKVQQFPAGLALVESESLAGLRLGARKQTCEPCDGKPSPASRVIVNSTPVDPGAAP